MRAWISGCVRGAATTVFVAACAAPPPTARAALTIPATPGGLLAGAAVADITPPIHLSLFGHGPESRISVGVRLRLHCQVFVLASHGEVVALVPCDLQSSSLALQRDIAERLRLAGVPITADRLYVMATHTHAGPAHFFEARRYSGPFSSMAPGYDEKVMKFLSANIADKIYEAFNALAPACIGWSQTSVTDLTINRAYVPFLANDPLVHPDVLPVDPLTLARGLEERRRGLPSSVAGPPSGQNVSPPKAKLGIEVAVDPLLSVLRIDRRATPQATTCEGSKPLGVLAVYGMHPTGVPNTNALYHGDIFGFAVRAAQGALSRTAAPGTPWTDADAWASENSAPGVDGVVVGLANGVEGDVSPNVHMQSMEEARALGKTLGRTIASVASETRVTTDATLEHLYWDLHFPQGQASNDPNDRLCKTAELGVQVGGGVHDGPTRLRVIPATNAGYLPDEPFGCHRYKLPLRAGGPSPYDFPLIAPIALIRIGNGVIATAPGEMTTMTGLRIRSEIKARIPAELRPIVLVGLTNQYMQYFATAEEYEYQYYEGASTLYGPSTERFLTRHFGRLADQLAGKPFDPRPQPVVNVPESLDAKPGPLIRRWPEDGSLEFHGAAKRKALRCQREGVFGWELSIDALPPTFTAFRDQLSVKVLGGADGAVVKDDDEGASIELRELDAKHWRVRWIPDLGPNDPRCGQTFRIAVTGRRVSVETEPFVLECDAPPRDGCPR